MTLLTRAETIARLRLKPAFFSKIANGKVKSLPRLKVVQMGRRQMFREETIEQWILDVEAQGATRFTEDR